MAISDSQKVDLLWKKVGFGKAKTDSNDSKKAPNEAITSDFVVKTDQIWAQSDSIPGVMPSANSSIVNVYLDSVSGALETTEDATSTDNRTWKTGTSNWISPGFGATYQLKVFAAPSGTNNVQTSGTQLFETGSGNDDQWYFDYQSGVLHFIGNNLPSAIGTGTSNVIHVAGAKYVGTTGLADAIGAAQTYRKSALTDVWSDTSINEGDIIEVANAGDGEYAVYLAKQNNPTATGELTLISTRDGAGADAATLTADVTFDSGTVTLGNVSSGGRPMSVVVDVSNPFDGTTVITVGDDNDPDRLMPATYVDLSESGTFVTNPSYVYTNAVDSDNTLKVFVTAGDSAAGNATILISYS
jgi:hypothetical protein